MVQPKLVILLLFFPTYSLLNQEVIQQKWCEWRAGTNLSWWRLPLQGWSLCCPADWPPSGLPGCSSSSAWTSWRPRCRCQAPAGRRTPSTPVLGHWGSSCTDCFTVFISCSDKQEHISVNKLYQLGSGKKHVTNFYLWEWKSCLISSLSL